MGNKCVNSIKGVKFSIRRVWKLGNNYEQSNSRNYTEVQEDFNFKCKYSGKSSESNWRVFPAVFDIKELQISNGLQMLIFLQF